MKKGATLELLVVRYTLFCLCVTPNYAILREALEVIHIKCFRKFLELSKSSLNKWYLVLDTGLLLFKN